MNATSEPFDASSLVKQLKTYLPHYQIDWEATGRCPSITEADCVVITYAHQGVGVKVKQQLAKVVFDERDSVTLIPLPGAGPTHIQKIRDALIAFIP